MKSSSSSAATAQRPWQMMGTRKRPMRQSSVMTEDCLIGLFLVPIICHGLCAVAAEEEDDFIASDFLRLYVANSTLNRSEIRIHIQKQVDVIRAIAIERS